ncbi:MAG: hypothetical protein Kow00124_22550 [Anaerolineae bacterium]
MDETLHEVRDSIINGLGKLTDFFGFSPVMGHLYGALLMSPEPLSLDELEEMVGKSKASVSMNMRALERWGMVREVWVKGDRRKFYEAESDYWKVIATVLQSRERREVGIALEVLDESVANLEAAQPRLSEEDAALAKHYLARVEDMRAFFAFAQMAIEFFVSRGGLPNPAELATIHRPDNDG